MKIDRLLGIVIYLLNHDTANTGTLAEKFEVSKRTIQRDMDVLNLAGIPIISTKGTYGGYGIMDGFSLNKQIASAEDYSNMITALKGLCSGYDNKNWNSTLEKIMALAPTGSDSSQKLLLDFSVLKENSDIGTCIQLIEKAIDFKKVVEFDYTDAGNNLSHRTIEPCLITYKWYSWYLFGLCCEKKEYRLFKIARITDINIGKASIVGDHRNNQQRLDEYEKRDNRAYIHLKLQCRAEMKVAAKEAFPGCEVTQQDDGDVIIGLTVPVSERMWLGSLLSFGDQITVLEPEEVKSKLTETAQNILNLYRT